MILCLPGSWVEMKMEWKTYSLVILSTGKANITDKAVRDTLFGGPMKNIVHLAAEGKLVVAGPFEKNDLNYRGFYF